MANIYQVARAAKVSPKTAARILSGGSQRSAHRDRVLACAAALGYVRNQQAANLRTGRSHLLGVMVPYIDNPFYTKFLQMMHDAMHAKGYQGLIACSFGERDGMLAALRLFESYNVDGVALEASEGSFTEEVKGALKSLCRGSRRIVVAGVQLQDVAYDHLYLDNQNAMAQVIKHLVARGRRDVGFLGGKPDNPTICNRLEGFKASLRKHRLRIRADWIALGDPSLFAVSQRAHRLLHGPDRPSAIVCTSDMIAMSAMRAALDIGMRVPDDVAVTGFDDIDQAKLWNPGLTTVRQPMELMAKDIVELLLRPRASKGAAVQEKRYAGELIVRGSA